MYNFNVKDLNWKNYLELNDIVKLRKFVFDYFSFIQLIQWQYYDYQFKFNDLDDVIVLYIKNKNEDWKLFNCFYKNDFNLEKTKEIIKQDLFELNKHYKIDIIDFSLKAIKDWKLDNHQLIKSPYISNYIYPTQQLKTFEGKKMIKKRNHLNAFLKNNYSITIKNLKNEDFDKLIEFTINLNKKYDNDIKDYEINIYHQFLFNEYQKDSRFVGTSYYIDQQLVGYTFGFINDNVFEIIIERAIKEIRGLYPFILKSNLNYHNIDCLFVDREDDLGDPMIAKSKKSYHPIEEIQRYSINDVEW